MKFKKKKVRCFQHIMTRVNIPFSEEIHEKIKELGGQSKAQSVRTNIKPYSFISFI